MQGRAFLDAARLALAGGIEPCWRVAAVEAYYSLMLECRDTLFRWGFTLSHRDTVHSWVRLRFLYSTDPVLRQIAYVLERLVKLRNQAQYDLAPHPDFTTPTRAQQAIQDALAALGTLDAIEADPARQAAARASIRP